MVDGAAEIGTAFALWPGWGRAWLLIGGAVSILLGIMIWRQFPFSGVWAIGVLRIKLLFGGMIMVAAGSTVRARTGVRPVPNSPSDSEETTRPLIAV